MNLNKMMRNNPSMTSHTAPSTSQNRFDDFFQDALYLSLKKSLFNYRFRKRKIAKHVPSSGRILDIGSGTAPVSPDLTRTVLADVSAEAMKNVEGMATVVTSITQMSFEAASFDCILCSEVLEHIQDDEKAVAELRRVLKPGGVLVVTVPFQKRFWAEDDEYVGHVRRYDPGELEQKLQSGGFQIIKTYKLSGMIERWLTRKSLQVYQKGGAMTRRPLFLLRIANSLLLLILIITEVFTSWKRTTRILIVAS
jgi:ubiquinone/menaquinone biosynthesis C-methylase UbiE